MFPLFASARGFPALALAIGPAFAQGTFPVGKVSLGGIYDFPVADHLELGIGGLVSLYGIPGELKPFYGSDPTSYIVFVRLKVL
jgi:hypothetical protein